MQVCVGGRGGAHAGVCVCVCVCVERVLSVMALPLALWPYGTVVIRYRTLSPYYCYTLVPCRPADH